MSPADELSSGAVQGTRADAVRSRQKLLAAAGEAFVESGVDVPVRDIATRAGVGMGTLYRHFPSRADLVVAVFRHQVEECAEAGPQLLASADSPLVALRRWIDLFVDFLVTKHGLAHSMQPDSSGSSALHAFFLERLLPVATELLDAAVEAGEIRAGIEPYEFMRGIGNLCIAPDDDPRYDPRRVIELLLLGIQQPKDRPEG